MIKELISYTEINLPGSFHKSWPFGRFVSPFRFASYHTSEWSILILSSVSTSSRHYLYLSRTSPLARHIQTDSSYCRFAVKHCGYETAQLLYANTKICTPLWYSRSYCLHLQGATVHLSWRYRQHVPPKLNSCWLTRRHIPQCCMSVNVTPRHNAAVVLPTAYTVSLILQTVSPTPLMHNWK